VTSTVLGTPVQVLINCHEKDGNQGKRMPLALYVLLLLLLAATYAGACGCQIHLVS
jgi:hypothetical protein